MARGDRVVRAIVVLAACASASPARADTQTATNTLSMAAYVRAYQARSNRARIGQLEIARRQLEVDRQRDQATRQLSVAPTAGVRLYHFAPHAAGAAGGGLDPVGDIGASAEYGYRGNHGSRYDVTARASLPTGADRLGRNLRYGIDGAYYLSLLRDADGREAELGAASFEHRRASAEADQARIQLDDCADATGRYVLAYATGEQLATYRELLGEKERVWRQTAVDFRKRMVTRLDLLASKSDWLRAQSLTPGFVERVERAEVALRAFADLPAALTLAEPTPVVSVEAAEAKLDATKHPRYRALLEIQEAARRDIELVYEQERSTLDLVLTGGVDRLHRVGDTAGQLADATDIHGLVGLQYLWPIDRPDLRWRIEAGRIEIAQVEQEKLDLARALRTGFAQAAATWRQETAALELIAEQQKVVTQQIRAAYSEFRAGKLEFQNYLDHWDRYQQVRLSHWERWVAVRMAEVALVALRSALPEVCRAKK